MDADLESEKGDMLRFHLRGRGIRDNRVLAAMAKVPRERFVGSGLRRDAYADNPLPIDCGQTISQPEGQPQHRGLCSCRFVPLVGAQAWPAPR